MCGRYALYGPKSRLSERFGVDFDVVDFAPRYNLAPMQFAPVIREHEGARQVSLLRWGLLPSWAKDETLATKLFNARSETAAEKPSFRSAMKARRCLIPADGFYEWAKTDSGKQPYYIHLASNEPMAMAGLWEHWRAPDDETLETFTILTTDANERIRPLHERMPVILPFETWGLWLNAARTPAQLHPLMAPLPSGMLALHPVGKAVGNARIDRPDLIESLAGSASGDAAQRN